MQIMKEHEGRSAFGGDHVALGALEQYGEDEIGI
jgi:hypothetical protein